MSIRRFGVAAAALAVLVSGCGLVGSQGGAAGSGPTAAPTPAPPRLPLVKRGFFSNYTEQPDTVAVHGLERHAGRSVLRMTVTPASGEPTSSSWGLSLAGGGSFGDVRLIDPVGRKAYYPLRDSEGVLGTQMGATWVKGARFEVLVYFPAVPPGTRTVSVFTPGTTGEFTGVPVVAPKPAPKSNLGFYDHAEEGRTAVWEIREPRGEVTEQVYDLYDITLGEAKTKQSTGQDETIALRTDVLFAFDKATLSAKARSVLAEVAAETKAKADPAKPPIIIEGHTDGRGSTGYNVPLSRRRAEAVRRELQAALGGAYRYQPVGRGETEPVAEEGGTDDEQARARNRRVEISYKIKQRTPGGAAAGSASSPPDPGEAPPARFQAGDGPVVATRTAGGRRLEVHPFRRDGHYLVAAFDVVNGPGGVDSAYAFADPELDGAVFGGFHLRDPASGTVYGTVRVGKEDPDDTDWWADPGKWPFRYGENSKDRGWIYFAAPPLSTKTADLDAGPYGLIKGVPIR